MAHVILWLYLRTWNKIEGVKVRGVVLPSDVEGRLLLWFGGLRLTEFAASRHRHLLSPLTAQLVRVTSLTRTDTAKYREANETL
jgi:hypothetical protein